MPEWTKIDLRHRRTHEIRDITDLMAMLFPGNRNQQHAAACIVLELRDAEGLVPDMAWIEREYKISRRTLQRSRAKLNRMGLIERVGFLNRRYHGQAGWQLSGRFSTALRSLANTWQIWREDQEPLSTKKDRAIIELMR